MLNVITLVGRLTDNVEIHKSKDGNVGTFFLAFNQGKDDTGFVKCVVFNATADTCEDFLHKGDKIAISGRFYDRQFTRKDESKGHESQILVNSIEFIDVVFDEQEEEAPRETPKATPKETPKEVAKPTRRSR